MKIETKKQKETDNISKFMWQEVKEDRRKRNIKKLHKWICIILFAIMAVSAFIRGYSIAVIHDEELEKWMTLAGLLAETPFMILLVVYLYTYRKQNKKEG